MSKWTTQELEKHIANKIMYDDKGIHTLCYILLQFLKIVEELKDEAKK